MVIFAWAPRRWLDQSVRCNCWALALELEEGWEISSRETVHVLMEEIPFPTTVWMYIRKPGKYWNKLPSPDFWSIKSRFQVYSIQSMRVLGVDPGPLQQHINLVTQVPDVRIPASLAKLQNWTKVIRCGSSSKSCLPRWFFKDETADVLSKKWLHCSWARIGLEKTVVSLNLANRNEISRWKNWNWAERQGILRSWILRQTHMLSGLSQVSQVPRQTVILSDVESWMLCWISKNDEKCISAASTARWRFPSSDKDCPVGKMPIWHVLPLASVGISKLYRQKTCITHLKKECGCHAIMLREVQHLGWLCKALVISAGTVDGWNLAPPGMYETL